MNTRQLLFLLTACFAQLSQAAGPPAPVFARVEPWTIAIDESMNSGCFIFAEFRRGTFLRIGKDNTENYIYVFLGDPHWEHIEYGTEYPISIQFGNQVPWQVRARGVSFDPPESQPIIGFIVPAKNDVAAQFLFEFMREDEVVFFHGSTPIARISLKNSYEGGLKLMECQKLMNQRLQSGVTPPMGKFASNVN